MEIIKRICLEIKLFCVFVWEDFEYRISTEEERTKKMEEKNKEKQ